MKYSMAKLGYIGSRLSSIIGTVPLIDTLATILFSQNVMFILLDV